MSGEDRGLLWAPWRMTYIRNAEAAEKRNAAAQEKGAARSASRSKATPSSSGCLFCRVRGSSNDRADLVVARRRFALLMLNRFPYNPAHLMVAVARHVGRFGDLTVAERADLIDLTALAERALALEYRPQGLNYGANVGRIAGAGFPGHLHLHLVPRWNGDTNFMPTVAATKVLPESLGQTWTRLRAAVRALGTTETSVTSRKRARRR
jgi:ATP adenylyltransferase